MGEGVFGRIVAAFDGFTSAPDRFVDGGDDIIVLGHHGGTMKHSGAKLDAPFYHVYRFSGEHIVSFEQYTDQNSMNTVAPSPIAIAPGM